MLFFQRPIAFFRLAKARVFHVKLCFVKKASCQIAYTSRRLCVIKISAEDGYSVNKMQIKPIDSASIEVLSTVCAPHYTYFLLTLALLFTTQHVGLGAVRVLCTVAQPE